MIPFCLLPIGVGAPHPQPLPSEKGVKVSVFGEGRLCFESGTGMAFASAATLVPSPAGLLADAAGRPVFPHVRLAGPAFAVSMNGTVSAAGRAVGHLMLQRAGGRLGHPGEDGFGVIQVEGKKEEERGKKTTSFPSPSLLPSSPLLISVHPRTEVEGDRMRLQDLADLSGDAQTVRSLGRLDLGDTPALGFRHTLSRWRFVAMLREAGLKDAAYTIASFPPDVTVGRKGQTVDAKTILDAVAAEARRANGGVEPALAFSAPIAPVLAPLGDLKVEATAAPGRDGLRVTAFVRVDGKTVWSHEFDYKLKLDGVRPGDAVRVAVACGRAALETDAKAKTAGIVGETIQVVTADGTVLTATVTGTGKAEVKL